MVDFIPRSDILDGLVVSAMTLGKVLKVKSMDVDMFPATSFDLTLK